MFEIYNNQEYEKDFFKSDRINAIENIISANYETSNPKNINFKVIDDFYHSIKNNKNNKALTQYSQEELEELFLYKVSGYNIGFGLREHKKMEVLYSPNVEIVSLHNNEDFGRIGRFW